MHQDAELLDLYQGWRAAMFAANLAGRELQSNEERKPVHRAADDLEARIRELPAQGPAGLAVKMRVVLAGVMSCDVGDLHVLICDNEPSEEVKDDCYPGMLWAAIQNAERLAQAEREAAALSPKPAAA